MGRTVAILSDFGYDDNYVGVMKGVIRRVSPFADIIDITHNVQPGDIRSAAFLIETSYSYFPKNTIFLCVVDPGVGSNRRAIALESDGYFFVAPDNGLLTPIINSNKSLKAVNLSNIEFHLPNPSSTFHGRDIFAPVAAHLSKKVELDELGEQVPIETLVKIENYFATQVEDKIEGNIVHKDSFGNLITDIPADWVVKKKRSKDLSCRV